MIILIPPGAGYDEEDHLVRVWELSALSFIPGQMSAQEMRYPIMFRDLAYRQQSVAGIVDMDFWQRHSGASLYERGYVHRELNTKSVYPPPLLLPQAILMRFGRQIELPALPLFYLCRFASLLSYLLLVWVAIRWIPFGKWILLVLALSPMALFQATTISPDAISNGIGFLFIAGCLSIAERKRIGWTESGSLLFLVFLLSLAKLNLPPLMLLAFLLIPPSRFVNKGTYAFYIGMTLLLFIALAAGWNILTSTRLDPLMANGANLPAQVLYILNNPFTFLQIVIKDFLINGWGYFQGWINGYGYLYWTPPLVVSLLFLLSLGSAIWFSSRSIEMSRRVRLIFIFVFVASYFATILSLYTTFTPPRSDQIFGVQGRYFIPLVLPLLLAFASLSWPKKGTAPSPSWIGGFLIAALSLNILGIFLSFYVSCGTTFYQTSLCHQPLYRDFTSGAQRSQPISNEYILTQEIQVAYNGLTEVRVWVIPSAQEDQGTTRFVLQDTSSDQILFDDSVPNEQFSEEIWYSLRFAPDWDSAGKQYTLEIFGSNGRTGQGLRVLYVSQPEIDLGRLYENGEEVQGNIVLQYGSITGLRKLWRTGKP